MKNTLIAAAVLSLSATAFAGETTTESHEQSEVTPKKAKHSTESKKKVDPDGMGNATTDSAKTDVDAEANADGSATTTKTAKKKHDAPGLKHDTASEVKTTTTTDKDGHVVFKETEKK